MKNPTMLYRCPGPHITDGIAYEYTIVDEDRVEATLAEGWHRNWADADTALKGAAEKLAENERELAAGNKKLEEAGEQTAANAEGLKAVHKGRGKWSLVDADGNEVKSGLTKEEAQAAAA